MICSLVKKTDSDFLLYTFGANGWKDWKEEKMSCYWYEIPLPDGRSVTFQLPTFGRIYSLFANREGRTIVEENQNLNLGEKRANLEMALRVLGIDFYEADTYKVKSRLEKYHYIILAGIGRDKQNCLYVECSEDFAKRHIDSSNYLSKKAVDFFNGNIDGLDEYDLWHHIPDFATSFLDSVFKWNDNIKRKILQSSVCRKMYRSFGRTSTGGFMKPYDEQVQLTSILDFLSFTIKYYSKEIYFKEYYKTLKIK